MHGAPTYRRRIASVLVLLAWASTAASSQSFSIVGRDACGYPDTTSAAFRMAASEHWGYGYDTLLYDLSEWAKSPFVKMESIGASVQSRQLYMLTITDTAATSAPRKRIWMHARTHPGEVQGTWVTNEVIKLLLSDTPLAARLRDSCIFNIVPMYNPDGVELGKARENANNIDIESNWDTTKAWPSQPEVAALRRTFQRLMADPAPISIALNMHSAYGLARYFVYHTPKATSPLFSAMQIRFIDTVRSGFPNAIAPYTYFISWTSTAATQYPESWFWYNCRESVLALTYEDMNDASANSFDKTANAIALGIGNYLGVLAGSPVVAVHEAAPPTEFRLEQNYPNPFNPSTTIRYSVPAAGRVSVRIYNMLGQQVAVLGGAVQAAGWHEAVWTAHAASGVYFYRIDAEAASGARSSQMKSMVLMK